MKTRKLVATVFMLLALLLSACDGSTSSTPTPTAIPVPTLYFPNPTPIPTPEFKDGTEIPLICDKAVGFQNISTQKTVYAINYCRGDAFSHVIGIYGKTKSYLHLAADCTGNAAGFCGMGIPDGEGLTLRVRFGYLNEAYIILGSGWIPYNPPPSSATP